MSSDHRLSVCLSVRPVLPVCDVGVLWPNGWMDQDATWYGGGPWPRRHCVRWGLSSPPQKRGHSRQFLALVYCGQTDGGMDQDATWYGGRPCPRPHCARWGPSSPHPLKGHSAPIFWHFVYAMVMCLFVRPSVCLSVCHNPIFCQHG